MCVAELVQLREVANSLQALGGRTLAICVDAPKDSLRVVEKRGLPFSILSDEKRDVLRAYDVLHPGGGPGGADIAVPAHLLIDTDGKIVYRHRATKIQDRPDPDDLIRAVQSLAESRRARAKQ